MTFRRFFHLISLDSRPIYCYRSVFLVVNSRTSAISTDTDAWSTFSFNVCLSFSNRYFIHMDLYLRLFAF